MLSKQQRNTKDGKTKTGDSPYLRGGSGEIPVMTDCHSPLPSDGHGENDIGGNHGGATQPLAGSHCVSVSTTPPAGDAEVIASVPSPLPFGGLSKSANINSNSNSAPMSTLAAGSATITNSSIKKTALFLAVVVPVLFVVTLRILHNNGLQLPQSADMKRKNVVDIDSPPVEMPDGETIAHLLETSPTAARTQSHAMSPSSSSSSFYGTGNHNPLSLRKSAPSAPFSRSASLKVVAASKNQDTIPVIVDRGEKIPTGIGSKKLSAAEALMCRESVVNYVINATNRKDECTGLQKAFDETCSQEDDEEDEIEGRRDEVNTPSDEKYAEPQDQIDNLLGQGGRQRYFRLMCRRRRRRFLTQRRGAKASIRGHGWYRILWYEASRYLTTLWEMLPFSEPSPKFHAQDAVYQLYPRVKRRELWHIVKNKKQGSGAAFPRARRRQEVYEAAAHPDAALAVRKNNQNVEVYKGGAAGMDEDDDVNDDDDLITDSDKNQNKTETTQDENPPPAIQKMKQNKPHNSLNLPTGQVHLSDKALEKTLLLQQEEKVLSDLKKAAVTNATDVIDTNGATPDPKEDAHASAKAVADTSELVHAVLNDPTAIEARACCTSILNVYHENCNTDAEEEISDKRLFIVVLIMAFCGMVKSLIRHFRIRWLPEAAGCILVGVASGYASSFFPHQDFNYSFDGNWFLRILVPPIVFEAALSIDKKSFNRHLVPIIIYSTVGTLFATVLTASIVYNGTRALGRLCEPIPYIESLIFGSLISSIDPIAVLSVLSNMGMTDTDTLYVLVFGESLLNDGVAIVLFQTLVQFLDASVVVDYETIMAAAIHFFVVALGSVLVGVGSGIMCTLYYWAFHGCQTPLVECLMFLCWALLPYYVCDGIGWSGIVSAVTVGFVMDMYVIGVVDTSDDDSEHSHRELLLYEDDKRTGTERSRPRLIFSGEGHLSAVARIHIGFVTEIVATMMETAIFAYLGLFLFSHRYHWNVWHTVVSILACCVSRAIMIPTLSTFANWITSMQKYKNRCRGIHKSSPAYGVIVDRKMQMVLWFAGLRGAMSFALVEHIPLFDAVTGEGTRMKAELKAMTSASIMFTVFVLGGFTNYFMDFVGLSPASARHTARRINMEMVPLTRSREDLNGGASSNSSRPPDASGKVRSTRQRVRPREDVEK